MFEDRKMLEKDKESVLLLYREIQGILDEKNKEKVRGKKLRAERVEGFKHEIVFESFQDEV